VQQWPSAGPAQGGATGVTERDLAGYARLAVYWAPEPDTALARLGAAWLGRDAETGATPERPDTALDAERLTARPRRYGLHATLKPPLRLARGVAPEAFDAMLAELAGRLAPVEAPPLAVDTGLGFAALRPAAPCPALDRLAAACVTGLDGFRAPPAPAEIEARRAAGLSPGQEENLRHWGYPYVLGAFRFHLTLTGPLAEAEKAPVSAALADLFAPALGGPLRIRHLCLFGDPGGGLPFRLLRRHALSG
jgi:putative phosphonate metabolism protein